MPEVWTGSSREIECAGCANTIQKSLGKLQGVTLVEVDVATKTIRAQYETGIITPQRIVERLEEVGFPVETA